MQAMIVGTQGHYKLWVGSSNSKRMISSDDGYGRDFGMFSYKNMQIVSGFDIYWVYRNLQGTTT